MKRVLGVASGGGHVVELVRLQPAFDGTELTYMSTMDSYASMFQGYQYYSVPDFSQWNVYRIPYAAFKMYKIMAKIKPDVVITTGAAPGVLALFIGWLMGAKTIWVEASCHTEKVSISGKICKLFAGRVYTQWPNLASQNVIYSGNVIQ